MITHRDTKEQCLVPLLASISVVGEKGGRLPPEGFLETYEAAKTKVGNYHIVATDGAQGFRATFRALGAPHSSAAVHGARLFTPVDTIDKAGLSQDAKRTLTKLAGNKQAKSVKHAWKIVGGDNKAESTVGQTKGQLRRTLKLGKGSKKFEHDAALCAQYIHHSPGLLSVFMALAQYRTAVQTRSNPRDCFKELPWTW